MDNFKGDVFQSDVSFVLEEASGEVDGKHIIAKVRGPFFVPDGESRNKRFYPKSLWEKQLAREDIQQKLKDRRMFGTIGHDQVIDDKALLDGKISHIVTDLAVEKNGIMGYGEAVILGTPAGEMLNTVLRARAKMFTSSRALGKFGSSTQGGTPKVDEDSYDLQTFDFVIDPGFLQANPRIAESYTKMVESLDTSVSSASKTNKVQTDNNEGEGFMAENTALLEKSMIESIKLREDLKGALKEVETLKNENAMVTDENVHLRDAQKVAEGYKTLGEQKAIREKLNRLTVLEKRLAAYEKLGPVEKLDKALTLSIRELKAYKAMGSIVEVNKALSGAKETLKKYVELGTPAQVNTVIEKFKTVVMSFKKEEAAKKVSKLSKELEVSEAVITPLLGKGMTEKEIKALVSGLKEENGNKERYTKTTKTPVTEENKPADGRMTGAERFGSKGRAKRLMESLGGKKV